MGAEFAQQVLDTGGQSDRVERRPHEHHHVAQAAARTHRGPGTSTTWLLPATGPRRGGSTVRSDSSSSGVATINVVTQLTVTDTSQSRPTDFGLSFGLETQRCGSVGLTAEFSSRLPAGRQTSVLVLVWKVSSRSELSVGWVDQWVGLGWVGYSK